MVPFFVFITSEFLKAKCLMNCEVSLILEHKYEQLQQMSDDPMNQISQWVLNLLSLFDLQHTKGYDVLFSLLIIILFTPHAFLRISVVDLLLCFGMVNMAIVCLTSLLPTHSFNAIPYLFVCACFYFFILSLSLSLVNLITPLLYFCM